MDNKDVPYIFKNNFTLILFIIILILIIYFSTIVYKYDKEMLELRKKNINYITKSKHAVKLFQQFNKNDMELINTYIYYIIDKKKIEKNKFEKIVDAFKNGFISGFLASSLSGTKIQNNIVTGMTFGATSALYKSIINYRLYKNLHKLKK